MLWHRPFRELATELEPHLAACETLNAEPGLRVSNPAIEHSFRLSSRSPAGNGP